MRQLVDSLRRDAASLIAGAKSWLARHWRWFAPVMSLVLILVWIVVHPHDYDWLDDVRSHPSVRLHPEWKRVAGQISDWGDFTGWNVILLVTMLAFAKVMHRPRVQRLALALFLSAGTAGLIAVLVRGTIGRARPFAEAADGFYGMKFQAQFQGCPSGHTATAFGLAIAWLIATPRTGWVALPCAIAVAWSRMYLNRHYPADILSGLWIALCVGIPMGIAARSVQASPAGGTVNHNTCR